MLGFVGRSLMTLKSSNPLLVSLFKMLNLVFLFYESLHARVKNVKFNFFDERLCIFNLLKEKLISAFGIVAPDWSLTLVLMCMQAMV